MESLLHHWQCSSLEQLQKAIPRIIAELAALREDPNVAETKVSSFAIDFKVQKRGDGVARLDVTMPLKP